MLVRTISYAISGTRVRCGSAECLVVMSRRVVPFCALLVSHELFRVTSLPERTSAMTGLLLVRVCGEAVGRHKVATGVEASTGSSVAGQPPCQEDPMPTSWLGGDFAHVSRVPSARR